jgi:hypothetical protein
MKTQIIAAFTLSALGLIQHASFAASGPQDDEQVERGR